MPNNIASFIMLYLSRVHFLKRLFTLVPHSDGESDQLGYCQFNVAWIQGFSNGHLAEMVLDRETHSDKQTFSSYLLGHSDRPQTLPFPKLSLLLGMGTDVTVSGARTS